MKLHIVLASMFFAGLGLYCVPVSGQGAVEDAAPTSRLARAPFQINVFRPAFEEGVRDKHLIIEASVWDYQGGSLPVDRVLFKDEGEVPAFLVEDKKATDGAVAQRTLLVIGVEFNTSYTGSTMRLDKTQTSEDGRIIYVPASLRHYCQKVKVAYVVGGDIQYETPAVSVRN